MTTLPSRGAGTDVKPPMNRPIGVRTALSSTTSRIDIPPSRVRCTISAHSPGPHWTHVRKLLGWDRYDSLQAQAAINDLFRHELRVMMNLYQPSVKLVRKTWVGERLHRRYDRPQTPLDRLPASGIGDPTHLRALQRLRTRLDPFCPRRSH